jgi:hypothetical protein
MAKNSKLRRAAEGAVRQVMQERRPKSQALLEALSREAPSTKQAREPLLKPNEEAMVAGLMQHFGKSRAEAISELMEWGFL